MKEIEVTVKKIKDPITLKRLAVITLLTMVIVGVAAVVYVKESLAAGFFFYFLGTGVLCIGIYIATVCLIIALIILGLTLYGKKKCDEADNEEDELTCLIINVNA